MGIPTVPVLQTMGVGNPHDVAKYMSDNEKELTSEYDGDQCQTPICTPTCQSSTGTCISPNNCTCNSGYTGISCTIPLCPLCVHLESCSQPDVCSCTTGWHGSLCDIPSCDGIMATNNDVCKGHGVCVDVDNCTCTTGYTGVECEIPSCFGISALNESVCNGNGECKKLDCCTCDVGDIEYAGLECEKNVTFTEEELKNKTKVCNKKLGECEDVVNNLTSVVAVQETIIDDQQTTITILNFTVQLCLYPMCFPLCSAHGACQPSGFQNLTYCQCDQGWEDSTCSTPTCQHTCVHGTCIAPGTCSCESGWSGNDCDVPVCPSGCVHGDCSSPNNCTCLPGYEGIDCDTIIAPVCDEPCQNGGTCVADNNCTCLSPFYGDLCQNQTICPTCPATNSTCGNMTIVDVSGNNCTTINNTAIQCAKDLKNVTTALKNCLNGTCPTLPICTLDCGLNGQCGLFGGNQSCSCDNGWYGVLCNNQTVCPATNSTCGNMTIVDVSGNNCTTINNTAIQCAKDLKDVTNLLENVTITLNNCLNGTCPTLPSCTLDCGSNGKCGLFDGNQSCSCDNGWIGAFCNISTCQYSCNNGECSSTTPGLCVCQSGWEEFDCSVAQCPGGCGNNGACNSPATCTCESGWTGVDCNTPICDISCNNGTCKFPNTCECIHPFLGKFCNITQDAPPTVVCPNVTACSNTTSCPNVTACPNVTTIPVCHGIPADHNDGHSHGHGHGHGHHEGHNGHHGTGHHSHGNGHGYGHHHTHVCSGHGKCVDDDVCDCDDDWIGPTCNITTVFECFGLSSTHPKVCRRHGKCVSEDECLCDDRFFGPKCKRKVPKCFGKSALDLKRVCSGRGDCVDDDVCECWNPAKVGGRKCECHIHHDGTQFCDDGNLWFNKDY